ncbi:MAG: catalase, partial [Clostridia bacterium]|nr:catalase [Clostridia bacterium]
YMGKNYDDTQPLKYFLKAKPRRIIHPETSDLLESWLVMLAEKGEKETFRYLKNLRKTNPNYGKEDL